MNKTLAILAVIVSILVVALACQGLRYTFVDAGGPQLRMFIAGAGHPAVVFENGAGEQLDVWRRTQDAVSEFATTIAYDRAGSGGSSDGPLPRDGRQVARELHAALQKSAVPPPYVLVGHSLGGLYVRIYASLYPQDVAALVLVDPSLHDDDAVDPEILADSTYPEMNGMVATMQQALEAPVPAGLPVYVISAMGAREEPWFTPADNAARERRAEERAKALASRTAWLNGLDNGRHIVTENSGHIVPVEQPALVIDTIREALARVASPR
jgi:pimeloyl-ACP methyl ester carboxylesterase